VIHKSSSFVCVEYLNQVRTKRRSLDRADLSSSPSKEIGEEAQEGIKEKLLNISCYECIKIL